MLVDPLSSGSRRLKGGGSQDWLPHFFDPVRRAALREARQTTKCDDLSH